jgi:glycosyltransferase involved in cell wall biosynthesis
VRIVLDLQAIQSPPNRGRGIGRVYRSLVREIVQQRDDHEVLVVISGLLYDYADEIWEQLSDILPIDCFRVWHGVGEASWCQAAQDETAAYRRQINIILYQAFLASLRPDVVLFGNFCDGYHESCILPLPGGVCDIPLVMICHDLIPLVYPRLYDDNSGHSFIDFYQHQLAYLKNAAHILTFSNSVKEDVIRFLDYPEDSVTMTSLGFTPLVGADLNSSQVEDVCRKYNLQKPFILFVSAQDPRKNHVGVIEAFAKLDVHLRDQFQLVFAGSSFADTDLLLEALQENDLPKSALSIAVNPTDKDLEALYKLAHLGIFPSLYEGFGLGILESMAFGLPVIASNTSSMPEVTGREDALFDPSDADNMASKMSQALTDEAFRNDLMEFGLKHARSWDWESCAQRAIAAFERLHSGRDGELQLPADFSPRQWAVDQIRALPRPELPKKEFAAIMANAATAVELTYPSPGGVKPRLLIDVSEFVKYDYNTGIQRVIKCVVIESARQLSDLDVALVYSHPDGVGYYHARRLQEHLLDGKPRLPVDEESTERVIFSRGDILFHSELTMEPVMKQRFYLQALRRMGVQTMFLVYDLIPIYYPIYHVGHTKKNMLNWMSCLVQGDKVISISKATHDDIQDCIERYQLPCRPGVEFKWFHLGGDFHNYDHPDNLKKSRKYSRVLDRYRTTEIDRLKGKVNFLTVGTIEPRKSHAEMLKVMESLWAAGVDANLIMVGKVGWLDQRNLDYIKGHAELGNRFFLFENLSDAKLNEIYGISTCLLYFSKVEGFGLPLIEAARHDLPIIVRDAPVFREVCGEHAFYFPDHLSPGEIAPYIQTWLDLYAQDAHPKSTHLPWLTWKDSVKALLEHVFSAPEPEDVPMQEGGVDQSFLHSSAPGVH